MNTKDMSAKIGVGGGLDAVSAESQSMSGALLAHLAPLFPAVAAATKSDPGAAAWVRSWASQIQLSALRPWQVERGLRRLHEHDPEVPFSWPAFYKLCRDPFRDVNDSELGRDDPEYQADRERKLREFKEKHPGVRFVNGPGAAKQG